MVFWQLYASQLIAFLIFLGCSIANSSTTAFWQIPPYDMQSTDEAIKKLYMDIQAQPIHRISERILYFSSTFLNRPYELGALGEGEKGRFDQKPLYRVDSFDCLTYVSTVLALVKSHSLREFQKNIRSIQYQGGEIDYFKRNHFISLDWNPGNKQLGFLKDITTSIKNEAGWPVYKKATTYLNKRAWYQHKTLASLHIMKPLSLQQAQHLLSELKREGREAKNEYADIDYIPLSILFDDKKKPNFYLFAQILDGSIIEIVRPNWDLQAQIGTHLDVSHMGFVVHTPAGIMFRQASSIEKRVVDQPLIDYLRDCLDNPTIQGINVQLVQ